MFKKILAVSALMIAPVAASAADLPRRSAAVAPARYAAPVFAWSGFYAGLTAATPGAIRSSAPAAPARPTSTAGWLAHSLAITIRSALSFSAPKAT